MQSPVGLFFDRCGSLTSSRVWVLTALTSDGLSPRGASDYFATDARPIILFDGVCNMCNGGVNFVLSFDTGEGCVMPDPSPSSRPSASPPQSVGCNHPSPDACFARRKTRFAALQSDAGRALLRRAGRAPNDISSIVLVERNRCALARQPRTAERAHSLSASL